MSNSRTLYYARISCTARELEDQIRSFHENGASDADIVIEQEDHRHIEDCPVYRKMQEGLHSGDTLVVMSLSCLGYNKEEIRRELQHYQGRQIRVIILDIPASAVQLEEGQEWVADNNSRLLIEALSALEEQERVTVLKRRREGIALAKAEGKYKGGTPRPVDEEKFQALYERYSRREISKAQMVRELGITRPRMDRLLQRKGLAHFQYLDNEKKNGAREA